MANVVSFQFLRAAEQMHPYRSAKVCSFEPMGNPVRVDSLKTVGFMAAGNSIGMHAIRHGIPDDAVGLKMRYRSAKIPGRSSSMDAVCTVFFLEAGDRLVKTKQQAEQEGISFEIVPDMFRYTDMHELHITAAPLATEIYQYPARPETVLIVKADERIVPVNNKHEYILNCHTQGRYNPLTAAGPT